MKRLAALLLCAALAAPAAHAQFQDAFPSLLDFGGPGEVATYYDAVTYTPDPTPSVCQIKPWLPECQGGVISKLGTGGNDSASTAGPRSAEDEEMDLRVVPNPLSSAGRIRYVVAETGWVRLAVYDALGREVSVVSDGERAAGVYAESVDAAVWSPGIYTLRMTAGSSILTQRLTVVR